MIQELFIYDREKGLFKEILKQSTVMQGRYHVSPSQGNDLNTNNLETFFKDDKNGLADAWQKYPLCICVTPRSRYITINNVRREEFTFNLYFVCTTFYTGTNQIKTKDPETNTSAHHIWYDWQDMKECAQQFIDVLKLQLQRRINIETESVLLKSMLQIDSGNVIFNRLTKFNNDRLSGVSVTFLMYMDASGCEYPDYPGLDDIIIPPLIIHELHTDDQ